ncbi:MAG TPA: ABC transporter permease subunit, partial [Candidatus Binataceae bacterium]|nr:ABC transporter permease subunit [Candidatus Binataceae bacterium]
GWYYLIACEIITVGPASYRLPGLGSFLMEAADKGKGTEIVAGLLTLLAIIVAMDVIVWQPLSSWAEKFRYEFAATPQPAAASFGMLEVFAGIGPATTRALQTILRPVARSISRLVARIPSPAAMNQKSVARIAPIVRFLTVSALAFFGAWTVASGVVALFRTLHQPWPSEVRLIPVATVASLGRIVVAYVISLAWTLPVALMASENRNFMRFIAPVAEIAGSMPATALFPLIVMFVVTTTGGMNLASILLILTGMQWYLLFNLLAGVNQIPEDLREATRSFGLSRLAGWRKLAIPALMPSLVTGSITAWGGGWNALILSEYFPYQGKTYEVTGLGALLDNATYKSNNGVMILLSLLSMVAIVLILNRLVWRRLYGFSVERYRLDY